MKCCSDWYINDCDATLNASTFKQTYPRIYMFVLYRGFQIVNTQRTNINLNVICSQTKIEPHKTYF